MNRNQIKYIAATVMLLDHIAAFLLPAESILTFIFRFKVSFLTFDFKELELRRIPKKFFFLLF